MKIGIVGDTSSLGIELKRAMKEKGHEIYGWSRKPNFLSPNQRYFSIDDKTDEIQVPKLDWVFVLSWKQSPRTIDVASQNVNSISRFIQSAKEQHIPIVFFSTLGAVGKSDSWHVKAKQQIEKILGPKDVIIRPGSIQNDLDQKYIGDVSWIDSLKIPLNIQANPPLYISTVGQSTVIKTCLSVISEIGLNDASNEQPRTYNLVSKVNELTFGPKNSRLGSIKVSQNLINLIFKILRYFKSPFVYDLVDKWFAFISVQEYNHELLRMDNLGTDPSFDV